MNVAGIYREIGKTLRAFGAEQIYILTSKTILEKDVAHLFLEVIVDHVSDITGAMENIQSIAPNLCCKLIDGADDKNRDLLREAETDGILL